MVLLVCFVWIAAIRNHALARRGGFAFFAYKMTALRRQANARRDCRLRLTRLGSESLCLRQQKTHFCLPRQRCVF